MDAQRANALRLRKMPSNRFDSYEGIIMDKLKSCPFCGSGDEADAAIDADKTGEATGWYPIDED